jgi:dynein heavy chain 2
MAALGDKCRAVLKSYTSQDYSKQKLLRLKVMSLLIDLMHSIDVVDYLVKERTSDVADWSWQKQLRFYINSVSGFCVARMVDAELDYTYEYQGNEGKLVHTPLTDKCYLTLTQGMHQGYGGNPYGPAGTGKTESVKMLGATLGRQVLVFNCDEGIDFKSMGRIIMGLVRCGAWGCFDEFNRLKEDQLSAVSQQIQVVQDAIKLKRPECTLMNLRINVDFNSAIFVTMNPAGKKYGGRSKLPDNLKTLFRPVAMSRWVSLLSRQVSLAS